MTFMRKYCVIIFVCFIYSQSLAQKITGYVRDEKGEVLSFSSILIKGTAMGVSANAQGFFEVDVQPGNYTIVCQHVGYKSEEKNVTVTAATTEVNFELALQQYNLKDVVVTSGGEDPAYEIIRNAIKKRPEYENELKAFECEVYIKGQLRLRDYPKRFLGQRVEFDDADTSKKKILFLSETIVRYSRQQPDKTKVEVLSTKVSGNSDGYGLSFPQIISFYSNNIAIGKNLNPRGFVSPIADNALNFYNYKLSGTFFENGKMINRIAVIPKRKFEPLFSGYINIIEDEWRIYSVQLQLLKQQQMQVLDTLNIEQIYVPVANTWLLKQQVLYPSAKLFGFDAYGSFVQVYKDFNVNPQFPANFFGNTILKFADSSNKKPNLFWDTIRPVPLQTDEIADYKKKDSLEQVRKNPHYQDSLDRKHNKPRFIPLLTTGQTFTRERKNISIFAEPVIDILNYNTVEGAVVKISPDITKRWKGRKALTFSPTVRYGFSNHHFNAHATAAYNFGNRYINTVYFSGGKRVFQFNNAQPVSPRANTIGSLIYERNFLKLYEAWFTKASYTKGIRDGFSVAVAGEYQDRYPLENTTSYKWLNVKERSFTPNYPVEISNSNIIRHQALSASIDLKWQPGAKYIEFPDEKVNIGSRYPTFGLTVTKGINVLGSDVDYTKWIVNVSDDINFKIAGRLSYKLNIGGFLDSKKVFLPDYNHFNGNRSFAASEYLNSFQLMYYYQYSNTNKFYTTAHVEYHLNGLLSNKIPLLRKLNWFFVVGANGLYLNDNRQYYEYFFSVENIFKILRFDFVQTYEPNSTNTSGIRFSLSGLVNRKED